MTPEEVKETLERLDSQIAALRGDFAKWRTDCTEYIEPAMRITQDLAETLDMLRTRGDQLERMITGSITTIAKMHDALSRADDGDEWKRG